MGSSWSQYEAFLLALFFLFSKINLLWVILKACYILKMWSILPKQHWKIQFAKMAWFPYFTYCFSPWRKNNEDIISHYGLLDWEYLPGPGFHWPLGQKHELAWYTKQCMSVYLGWLVSPLEGGCMVSYRCWYDDRILNVFIEKLFKR